MSRYRFSPRAAAAFAQGLSAVQSEPESAEPPELSQLEQEDLPIGLSKIDIGPTELVSTVRCAIFFLFAESFLQGGYHNIALTKDGKILVWGFPTVGKQASREAVSVPWRSEEGIIALAAGGYHNVILTGTALHACLLGAECIAASGQVFTFGRGYDGQLGHGTLDSTDEPRLVSALQNERIVLIAAGYSHTLAYSESGALYAWGDCTNGRCGIEKAEEPIALPTRVRDIPDTPLKAICGGGMHSILLLSDGRMASAGFARYGATGTSKARNSFQIIRNTPEMRAVSCGGDHTLALAVNGSVYAFGWNGHGQAGQPFEVHRSAKLNRIEVHHQGVPVRFQAVAAGGYAHSLALSDQGDVFAWGWGAPGHLQQTDDTAEPIQVAGLPRVKAIYSGSYKHNIFLADDALYGIGQNNYNQLGVFAPAAVPEISSEIV